MALMTDSRTATSTQCCAVLVEPEHLAQLIARSPGRDRASRTGSGTRRGRCDRCRTFGKWSGRRRANGFAQSNTADETRSSPDAADHRARRVTLRPGAPTDAIVPAWRHRAQSSCGPPAWSRGRLRVPGDKSISHRYALLAVAGATARRSSAGSHPAPTAAPRSAASRRSASPVERAGRLSHPHRTWSAPGLVPRPAPLDAGNSGTTTRLLAGILAGQPLTVTLTGDASLSRRPMRPRHRPARADGRADRVDRRAAAHDDPGRRPCRPSTTRRAVPSAQVKSAVLLAGLGARGITRVTEARQTRNHTELALRRFGVTRRCRTAPRSRLSGGQALAPIDATFPAIFRRRPSGAWRPPGFPDPTWSSRASASIPTRTGLLDVLGRAGAAVDVDDPGCRPTNPRAPCASATGRSTPFVVEPGEVPGLIDELPALAALATFGGAMTVTGAGELRVKESDRISALVRGLALARRRRRGTARRFRGVRRAQAGRGRGRRGRRPPAGDGVRRRRAGRRRPDARSSARVRWTCRIPGSSRRWSR